MANLKLNDSNIAEGNSETIAAVNDSSYLVATTFYKLDFQSLIFRADSHFFTINCKMC